MTSRSKSSKLLSDHTSFVVTKSKVDLFNKYLTTFSGSYPVLVAADLTGSESGQGKFTYIPKLDGIVGRSFTPKLPEDVLMAVTGAEFACVQLLIF